MSHEKKVAIPPVLNRRQLLKMVSGFLRLVILFFLTIQLIQGPDARLAFVAVVMVWVGISYSFFRAFVIGKGGRPEKFSVYMTGVVDAITVIATIMVLYVF